jgi:hypothetical protein
MTKSNRQLRIGDPIPGSRFFRAYCRRCNEPMRVDGGMLMAMQSGRPVYCEQCDPKPLANTAATKEEGPGPWGENAVRAMEDQ